MKFRNAARPAVLVLSSVLVLSALSMVMIPDAAEAVETITLRSGNAPANQPDPSITMLTGTPGGALLPNPFTASDFAAACSGPNATVTVPISVWLQQLACDPMAQWIGIDWQNSPGSALYCQSFDIQTCCIESATLSFCWSADDNLGDALYGGANPDGVYLNGVAVSPSITGGNYAAETQAGPVDVTSLVQCGINQLQVYNRDAGFAVSGVIYTATLDIIECMSPAEDSSWSSIKALYK